MFFTLINPGAAPVVANKIITTGMIIGIITKISDITKEIKKQGK